MSKRARTTVKDLKPYHGEKKVRKLEKLAAQRAASMGAKRTMNQGVPAVRGLSGTMGHSAWPVKSLDTVLVSYNFSTTGSVGNAPIVQQGAGYNNRIGQLIKMKSLHITGFINTTDTNSAAVNNDFGRMLLVYDRSPVSGVNVALSTVLADTQGLAGTQVTTAFSGVNMLQKDRFKIIRDWRFFLPPLAINGAPPMPPVGNRGDDWVINEFIKLNDLESLFNATNGGTVADIVNGSLILYTVSQFTVSTAYQATVQMRLRYRED